MRPRLALAAAFVAPLVLGSGCATAERERYVEQTASEFSYASPLSELWPQVLEQLRAEGYEVRLAPTPYEAITEWQAHGADTGGTSDQSNSRFFTRYWVQGFRLQSGHSQLRAFRQLDVDERRNRHDTRDPSERNLKRSAMYERRAPTNVTPWAESKDLRRDRAFEWRVLRRVEPVIASQIELLAQYRIR